MWNDMFVLALPVIEKILRPVVVYLALVVLLRIFGKRELAQLNPFDLVVLLTLSNTVQNAIIGNDNSISGGTFSIKGKKPPRGDVQYAELVRRLESIDTRLAALAGGQGA
jgi:hypothetical protein